MDVRDHEWPEIIAMIGRDPGHPNDIDGTFSVDLAGETHYINRSSLVCIPSNTMHCPWKFLEVKKPTLTIMAGPFGMYYSSEENRW